MVPWMNLEIMMNTYYEDLQMSDKQILKQILQSKEQFQHLSCEQIAQACHISRATLLRLCRKIGLQSFSELKYVLKQQEKTAHLHMDFHNVCDHYHMMLQGLMKIDYRAICERLESANTIYIYGTGNEQKSIAEEFKRIFLFAGKCVIEIFDEGELKLINNAFQQDDLFVLISLSGEHSAVVQMAKMLAPCIHTLSITRLQNNTLSALCEHNLYVATQKISESKENSYELVALFYALLDMLLVHYLQYKEKQRGSAL